MNLIDLSKVRDKYVNIDLFDVIEKYAMDVISVNYNYCELLISCISILFSVQSRNENLNLSFNLKDGNILKLSSEDLMTTFFRMYSYLGVGFKEYFCDDINIDMYLYELFILNQSMLNKDTFECFNEIYLESILNDSNGNIKLDMNCLRDMYNTAFKSVIVCKYNFMVNYAKCSHFKRSKYLKYSDTSILDNNILNKLIMDFLQLTNCCDVENPFLKPLLNALYSLIE